MTLFECFRSFRHRLASSKRAARWFTALVGTLAVAAVFLLLYGAYCTFTWKQWAMYDYGVYTNMVWNSGHGAPFRFGLDRSYLLTHLSFSLALLGPFFRVWDHPLLLMVAQWALFAWGWLLLWRVAARRGLRPDVTAAFLFFAAAYPFTQGVLLSSFHGVSLYLFLLPALYYCLQFKKHFVWVPLLLLLGLREDAFLMALPLLAYFTVRDRWRMGWVWLAVALLYGLLALTVLFEWINGMSLLDRRDGELSVAGAKAWYTLKGLRLRAWGLGWALLPTLYFWRRGGLPLPVLGGLPLLIAMLSGDARQYQLINHYPAAVMAGLTIGVLECLTRDAGGPARGRFNRRSAALMLTAVTVAAHLAFGFLWLGRQYHPRVGRPHAIGPILLEAAAHIPREGVLLCPFRWGGLCANRAELITWRKFDPGRHRIDVAFAGLADIRHPRMRLLHDWLETGTFGVSHFDGNHVVMRRGFSADRNAEVLAAVDEDARSISLNRTLNHAGDNRTGPGGVPVRYYPGKRGSSLVYTVFGKTLALGPGRYRADFHFAAEALPRGGANRGSLSLHRLGEPAALSEAAIGEAAGRDTWLVQTLPFELSEPTDVEPRVAGGGARLWLDRVVFRQVAEQAPAIPPEPE